MYIIKSVKKLEKQLQILVERARIKCQYLKRLKEQKKLDETK